MIKALKNQVIVEPIYDSDYYNPHSQLIKIPETSKERCDQGIVKYIGSKVDPEISIGSHVIYSGYSGTTVKIDNEILIILLQSDIKAIISEEDNIVPGLYFKQKVSSNKLEKELRSVFSSVFDEHYSPNNAVDYAMQEIAIYINEVMIPAQYEDSIKLIAESRSFIDVKEIQHGK